MKEDFVCHDLSPVVHSNVEGTAQSTLDHGGKRKFRQSGEFRRGRECGRELVLRKACGTIAERQLFMHAVQHDAIAYAHQLS